MIRINALGIMFFGIYACMGFLALIQARWRAPHLSRRDLWELTSVYLCCMSMILFEVARSVWDCFHREHFPLYWSDGFLFVVLIALGYLTFSIYFRLPEPRIESDDL